MSAWQAFPALDDDTLRGAKQAIDQSFRAFTRAYGEHFERAFEPLQQLLIWAERTLAGAPWPLVLVVVAALSWLASRSWRLSLGAVAVLVLIGVLGMWHDAMATVSMIIVSTALAVLIGAPVGLAMARSDRLQRWVTPLLDMMQTLPSFVYLIPVVMLLGIGRVPGLLAVVVYALPPMIRLTNLGIRGVDPQVLEAARAFGASPWQRLLGVQLPLAMPTLMAAVNQTIMMALSMVVVASMIGVQGLGQAVLRAISNQYFALGLFNGLAIVGIAVVFDRITQAWGRRLQAPAHNDAR